MTPPMMDQPHQTSSTQRGRPRQRSAVACTWCHSRRVKCNAAAKGTPCSNCEGAGRNCMLIESKRGKKRKVSTSPAATHEVSTLDLAPPAPDTPTGHGNVYDPLKAVRNLPKEGQHGRQRTSSISTYVTDKPESSQEPHETLYAQVLDKATTGVAPDVKEGVIHVMVCGALTQKKSPTTYNHPRDCMIRLADICTCAVYGRDIQSHTLATTDKSRVGSILAQATLHGTLQSQKPVANPDRGRGQSTTGFLAAAGLFHPAFGTHLLPAVSHLF
jgi:hypothetical protein